MTLRHFITYVFFAIWTVVYSIACYYQFKAGGSDDHALYLVCGMFVWMISLACIGLVGFAITNPAEWDLKDK